MVHEKESRVSAFNSGFDSGKVVRKKALGMFDSVRSTSSVEMFSQSSSGGDDTEFDVDEEIPSDEEVERRFSLLLDKMMLPPERAGELMRSPKGHKWKMIKAKEMMQPKYTSGFYIEQLKNHRNIGMSRSYSRKMVKHLEPVEMVLRSLEVDLRTHPNTTWLREFIDDPFRGHMVLVEFLQYLHLHPPQFYGNDDTKQQSSRGSRKGKPDVFARDYIDEHLCLLCLRVLMKNKYGFTSVMSVNECLKAIVLCLRIDSIKTQALVIKAQLYSQGTVSTYTQEKRFYFKNLRLIRFDIHKCLKSDVFRHDIHLFRGCYSCAAWFEMKWKMLTHACSQSEYHHKVIDAITFYMRTTKEAKPFQTIVNLMFKRPILPQFQELCLVFLNAIITGAPSFNQKVYHQQELENAGFDPDRLEQTLEGIEARSVREQLKIWRSNYINVQSVMDEFVTLRERSKYLRDEVDLLQSKLEERERILHDLKNTNNELESRSEEYRLRAVELQGTLENLVKVVKNEAATVEVSEEVMESISEAAAAAAEQAPPPPPPPPPPGAGIPAPPPPPLPGDSVRGNKHRVALNRVRLPMLNWTPITQDGNSFFKEIDDCEIMDILDFEDFDKKFELKSHEMTMDLRHRKEQAMKRAAEEIHVIEPKRARNLVIARRRIQHPAEEVGKFINKCDLVELPSEHAELLLKFIPTKEELSGLSQNADRFDKLAEAEQFMFQMAKVERYEAKLSIMAFMGVFDELTRSVIPQIDAVLRASTTIVNSTNLKKLFKIILVYGNYMNAGRRGIAHGFRLDSLAKLEDTRTTDRKQSFLCYLVDVVSTKTPEIARFVDELHLEGTSNVSLETLAADVQGLRKGLDLAKSERDKQANNFIVYNFYSRAFRKVQRVTERFRKMDEAYSKGCKMFGENPKTKEPSEFFKSFKDFVDSWKKAEKDREERRRLEETEARAKHLLEQERMRRKLANAAAEEGKRRSQIYLNSNALQF